MYKYLQVTERDGNRVAFGRRLNNSRRSVDEAAIANCTERGRVGFEPSVIKLNFSCSRLTLYALYVNGDPCEHFQRNFCGTHCEHCTQWREENKFYSNLGDFPTFVQLFDQE